MENVDASGGRADGKIDNGVGSMQAALEKVKNYKRTNIAYMWHEPTRRLIEKDPAKRAGNWKVESGIFFMWVEKIIDSNGVSRPAGQ